ncbi:DUF3443 domain-containing protein [Ramlibacter sp. G-1-2-2]|uniref:DUF3443 domain-containing protein n=1 Tax=Ramlibacter agri TaxID=2728837 RepID=A0A848H8Z5_9BURK|nr:DUF3443 domain-containing protein [Ramlibacter agri]NML44128.1 DUF3443 domain-containing protein [Ramlibacter agri]
MDLRFRAAACCALAVLLVLAACGGGGDATSTTSSTTSTSNPGGTTTTSGTTTTPAVLASNQVAITVDGGTDGSAINSPFVQVTVCTPGSASCQTIGHILLDTGSYGLRIAASALGGQLSGLPVVKAPDGNALAECAGFVSGFTWGSVRTAEVHMGDEVAQGVPIQVIDDTGAAYASVPSACSSTGSDLGSGAGANGILGVGFLTRDCGADCTTSTAAQQYFSCTTDGSCGASLAPLASQVANPVALFGADNNGLAISLPAVAAGGATRLGGTLTFGIGTAANNALGSAQVFTANGNGNFTTVYQGRSLTAFVDSGSNGIFFHDRSIPSCSSGFYCPSSTLSLTATASGSTQGSAAIAFTVENAGRLSSSIVADHLGGDISGFFDWGLPFFFGRTVFVALRDASTPAGTGPYWAF